MIVNQILGAAGPRDAVTAEARQYRAIFAGLGWTGQDYAGRLPAGLTGFAGLAGLRVRPQDVLLFHHSGAIPQLGQLLALPNPKLLVYHNITPAEYLWDTAPLVAAHCAVGRYQLKALVQAAAVTAGHSEFTARELSDMGATDPQVIPLSVDLGRLGPAGGNLPPAAHPTILFVGRLSPHKRQDELIRAFGRYQSRRGTSARLVLVGERLSNRYLDTLHTLARSHAPGRVTIESGLTASALGDRYRSASAFVCLSEHEGFCAPLLEAFHAEVPVIARPNGAIPEVAGDAALLVEDEDLNVVAELIDLAVTDAELRAELVARGRRRVEAFTAPDLGRRLKTLVEAATATDDRD